MNKRRSVQLLPNCALPLEELVDMLWPLSLSDRRELMTHIPTECRQEVEDALLVRCEENAIKILYTAFRDQPMDAVMVHYQALASYKMELAEDFLKQVVEYKNGEN